MKRTILSIAVAVLFLAMPAMAQAQTFSMVAGQLSQLYETYESPDIPGTQLFFVQALSDGAKYSGNVNTNGSGWAQIQIGANYWGIPWGGSAGDEPTNVALGMGSLDGYESYSQLFTNNNENPWMYNLYVNVGYTDAPASEDDWYFQSPWTEIAAGDSALLTMDFTHMEAWKNGVYQGFVDATSEDFDFVDPNHISNIGFSIGGNMPVGPEDYTFETIVGPNPVPEPASLSLLGLGLIGLLGRKRIKS